MSSLTPVVQIGLLVGAVGIGGFVGSYRQGHEVSIDGETRQVREFSVRWTLLVLLGIITVTLGGIL